MKLFLPLFLLTLSPFLPAQTRLIVAGNTADADLDFYRALDRRIGAELQETTVLLVGDFVADCQEESLKSLKPLLSLVGRNLDTKFYLVPGDRDWDNSGRNGLYCVRRLENYLTERAPKNLRWPLGEGCPGPEIIELSPRVLLMLVNTQWWNHPFEKPVPAEADCPFSDPAIAWDEMASGIEENQDRNVIIAGHFPPKSQGRRGGKFPVRDHLLPPFLGSVRLSYRQNVGSPQDLANERFQVLADELSDLNAQFEGLVFIGAQDRSQQLLKYRKNHIVNVGAAGPGRWAARHKPARHVSRQPGFTELIYWPDGAVRYRYYQVADGEPALETTETIYYAPCDDGPEGGGVPNPAFPPCEMADERLEGFGVPQDSARLRAAGPQYARSRFGETFLGAHYRDTWTTPVTVPLLKLDENPLGLRPYRVGGGRQTTSLRLRAENGESYAFRSVDKDPAGTFDFEIRPTIIGDVIRDQTSSGHPYGGLVVAPLLDPLGILHADPKLYELAPGPALGDYNPEYAGLLGTLEIRPQRDKKKKGRPGTFGADEVWKSYELFRERYDDQEVLIDHREFLRARLFDLLIGDWSRHEDNWKWAAYERGDSTVVRPIPRDRDNAFSRLDGVFPWIAARRWAVPNLEHFGYGPPDIRSLTHQARHMDRLLLSPLGRADFLAEAHRIQAALTDERIEAAVRQMPPEAYAESGPEMVAKLRARRNQLTEFAEKYYELHAGIVDILGTNDEERFDIRAEAGGGLTVTITDVKGKSEGKTLYRRTFYPGETREIRLYGLGDDDVFNFVAATKPKIDIRVIGGDGQERVITEGVTAKVKPIRLYDDEAVQFVGPTRGVLRRIDDRREELYYYDRASHEYNTLEPIISAGFNSFNGFQLGAGVVYTRRSYSRRDYSSRYRIYAGGSTLGNAVLEGSATFGEALGPFDLIAAARLGRPEFMNFFFGVGPNTTIDQDLDRNEFYLVQLQHFSSELGLQQAFAGGNSYLRVMAGYQNNETVDRENTILDREDRLYGDGDFVFGYLQPEFLLDLRDHPRFPSKGVLLEASQKWGRGRGPDALNFGVTSVAGEIHLSTRRFPISLSLRAGWAGSQGEAPFYELPAIGRDNGLRGFQRNRFVGDGYVFWNAEFRSPVALVRSRVAPFAIGIRAFYDRGRLITYDEEDSPFRTAYGGGVYIIPLSRSFTVSALAGFSEEESFLLQVGAGTNF